jgi:hypothetical protein
VTECVDVEEDDSDDDEEEEEDVRASESSMSCSRSNGRRPADAEEVSLVVRAFFLDDADDGKRKNWAAIRPIGFRFWLLTTGVVACDDTPPAGGQAQKADANSDGADEEGEAAAAVFAVGLPVVVQHPFLSLCLGMMVSRGGGGAARILFLLLMMVAVSFRFHSEEEDEDEVMMIVVVAADGQWGFPFGRVLSRKFSISSHRIVSLRWFDLPSCLAMSPCRRFSIVGPQGVFCVGMSCQGRRRAMPACENLLLLRLESGYVTVSSGRFGSTYSSCVTNTAAGIVPYRGRAGHS